MCPAITYFLLFAISLLHGAEGLHSRQPRSSVKTKFLQNLDDPSGLNKATRDRTRLVADLIQENPTRAPGSQASFTPLAVGTWRVIYAPHIVTIASLLQGSFDPVYYMMKPNGEMTSHVRYQFPLIGSGWLSVSGTYSSQDEKQVCRVDFDKTWVTVNQEKPFPSLEMVPDTPSRALIQTLGKLFFIEAASVFPVSYLDRDTIVFDFELLGTRICARKVEPKVKW